RKYVEKQQRGLFGVGLKMIAAFSTKDTDHPMRVWSKSEEESECYFDLRTDIGTNKPITLFKKNVKNDESQIEGESGFKVEAVLRAKLSPVTKNKIYDYISQTSIVNPYAIITFETDDEHELIKVVNICKHTTFQSPNTDHFSPIGEKILTVGMTSE